MEPASKAKTVVAWVHQILKEERDIVIGSRPLEATAFQVENIRMAYVGFKLSDGMEVPEERAARFKFARQKSKLAVTIRGSY